MLGYMQSRAFTHSGALASRHFFGLGPNPTLQEMEAIRGQFIVLHILPQDTIEE
jgi:hypothetical protein